MKQEILKEYLRLFLRAGAYLTVMALLFSKVFFLNQVRGMEMAPSLKDGDLAFGLRIGQEYESGDVIVCQEEDELAFVRIVEKAEGQENAWIVQKDALVTEDSVEGENLSEQENLVVSKEQIKGKVLTILRRRGI